jgi:hypothetical protein
MRIAKRNALGLRVAGALAVGVAIGSGLMATEAWAQGCAMCRTALGSAEDPLAQGFFWSILAMMAGPYLVVGSIGGWLTYRYLAASREAARAAEAALEPAGSVETVMETS